MIPASFNYKKASSVEEALKMLDEDAQILGGGHSLIPALKLRLNAPGTLVDISKIESIKNITDDGDAIVIGGGATHASIANHAGLAEHCPMMVQAASEIGDIQVRNCGTIGGSIAHADPAADWPAVLIAADAKVTVQNKGGSRSIAIDQFFTGFYATALKEGDIITAISIPKTASNRNSTYVKFKQPASRFAIVGCAVAADTNGGRVNAIRIGITGVGESAYRATNAERALAGKPIDAKSVESAVQNITDGVSVMGDHYASEKYRTHLAHVFTKRALMKLA